jgi:histidyl-tRNA synthetase
MSITAPRTPAGTMELLPREQMAFQHMLDVIRRGYERFGFVPVETPVFEVKDVLLTKSGGETEKQVYLVQSSGAREQGHEMDLALRFDLTVPLARYVAEHEHELAFPFRRYQMQRVYRGERAQKGRFREFYQCDIDVTGKDKLDPIFDAEMPAIIAQVFGELNIGEFVINFSNRKILLGLAAALGINTDQQALVLREIDKLDKIGGDKVREALIALGMSGGDAEKMLRLVGLKGSKTQILAALQAEAIDQPQFVEGVTELTAVVAALTAMGVPEHRTNLNLAIARGLDYYTGTVYETFLTAAPQLGSICSGGRYENLASHYTKSKLPGVGISIGATRLFDYLRSNNWQGLNRNSLQVLVANLDPALRSDYLALATQLRVGGINTEVYLETAKLDKQLKYADRIGVPFCILLGGDEKARGSVTLKHLHTKQQDNVPLSNLVQVLQNLLHPTQ